jgi:molybdate transport system substrate-binding protein
MEPSMPRLPRPSLILALLLFVLAACAAPAAPAQPPTLTVFAAASLADAFDRIISDFSAETGIAVVVSYAGSQDLVTQLAEGAPVDVLATAGNTTMATAVAGGRIDAAAVQPFAGNRLALVVADAAAARISGLGDLARAGTSVVLAAESVPAGSYARQLLERADQQTAYGSTFSAAVLANVVSFETNVRAVLSRVELGEADVGIVYASDAVTAADSVSVVDLPDELNPPVTYPLAVVVDSPQAAAAAQFVAYVLSDAGQAVLTEFGFLAVKP